MGEIHSGSVHLSDRWELHQCSLRAHRDRDHHHRVRTVRMLRHVPRESMVLKLVSLVSGSTFYIKWCPKTNRERVSLALSFSSTPCSCLWCSWPSWSLASRALFSVMRWDVHTHILRRWPLMRLRDLHLSRTRRACSGDIWQSACVCVCVFTQIKGTFMRTYNEAIQNYNAQDERSIAVDNVQRSVRSNTG